MRLHALLGLGLLSAARCAQDTPITKVVELIEEMKAKIMADGKAEQQVYDKSACWCEKTMKRKAAAMDEEKSEIEMLNQKIVELNGKVGALKAETIQLEKDVASNQASAKEAANVRAKETKDYESASSDLEQAIGALERAIGILTGAGEKSVLQESQFLSIAKGVQGALRMPGLRHKAMTTISEEDRKVLVAFVKDPEQFARGGHKFAGVQGPVGDYAPASTAIQGILKGMYDAFTGDLESKNAKQAEAQKNYEELAKTSSDELAALQSTLANKQFTLGGDTKARADANTDRDATKATLADDLKFFEDTKAECKERAEVWSTRSRLRTEELAGVDKALQILTGPDAMATFGRSNSMLLQTYESPEQQRNAYMALKHIAGNQHSLRLAAMAAKVHAATRGHFDEVIVELDKMLDELRAEEQDDIDIRDYCQEEENKVHNEIEDLVRDIRNTDGLIERLKSKKGVIQDEIKAAEDDMTETEDAMAEALSNRNAENEDFKSALRDDQDAVSLIASAIQALTSFYESNKLPLGLMQTGHRHIREPEYAEDPDKMPEDAFSEPYGGKSHEGGGIVSILGYLKEDVEKEIKTTKAAEAETQAEFAAQKAASLEALEALKKKKYTLEIQESETDEAIADAEDKNEADDATKGQKKQYQEDLKPKCEWMKGAFDTRREKRQAEMSGLLSAKNDLAGGGGGFLQRTSASLRGAHAD